MYSPKFRYTHMSVKNLLSIERARVVVDMLPLPADVERKLRDRAKLSMAHYSTRIEGNPLDYSEAQKAILGRKDRRGAKAEQEVRNYWDALTFLRFFSYFKKSFPFDKYMSLRTIEGGRERNLCTGTNGDSGTIGKHHTGFPSAGYHQTGKFLIGKAQIVDGNFVAIVGVELH